MLAYKCDICGKFLPFDRYATVDREKVYMTHYPFDEEERLDLCFDCDNEFQAWVRNFKLRRTKNETDN